MNRVLSRIVLGGILLAGLIVRVVSVRLSAPFDDAYITFRYVENLASGHGFVYNIGERVLGTTTPLYTLLLVPFTKAGLPLDTTAIALAIFLDLAICALLYLVLRRTLGDAVALVAALFYALSYAAVAACGFGMETQLFVLLVLTAIGLAAADDYAAAAAVTALAVLTRPEGFLLAGILGASLLIRYRRELKSILKPALVFLAVAAPWFIFAAIYFGSPLPNSVTAKIAQSNVSAGAWLDFFVTRNPLVMLLWLGAGVGFAAGVAGRNKMLILLGVWAVVHTVFFLFARPPFWLGHYFAPSAMPIVVLSGVGAAVVVGWLLKSPVRGAAAAAALGIVVFAVVFPKSLTTARWNRTVVNRVFRPLAEWVGRETPPDAVVHASDIGYLGYYSRRRIMDAAALVTPDVKRYYAEHGGEPGWDVAYVLKHLPDFVVLPVRGTIVEKFTGGDFFGYYEPVVRYQAEGATDLHPPAGTGERYSRDGRFVADYIVYRRVP
jgi:4-amino-4-deoxy-L-arabinose transferase-like glycosyltransferase